MEIRTELFGIRALGVIHTPFRQAAGTPIQPVYAEGAEGCVQIDPDYADGLRDLEGFDRIWLLYLFDERLPVKTLVTPFRDKREHGVFATRAPCRPARIGMSCVRLLRVEESSLTVADVDMLDGTRLLDIKPYIPRFDAFPGARAGWMDASASRTTHADARFTGEKPPQSS